MKRVKSLVFKRLAQISCHSQATHLGNAGLDKGDNTCREIRRLAGGMGLSRCERLLGLLESDGKITSVETIRRGNTCRLYHLKKDVVRDDVPRDHAT